MSPNQHVPQLWKLIEAEAAQLESVYLYTVDDLAKVVRTGQETRQSAVKEAEIIIDSGVHQIQPMVATTRSCAIDSRAQCATKKIGAVQSWPKPKK